MLEKIKNLFSLDYFNEDEPVQHSGTLIDIRTLQGQVRELQEVVRKQNAIMRDLSEDNIRLGYECKRYADTVAVQQRLIDVYENMNN
jgi:hypothetical protein|nr:MAG TPA: hypothetical protein [Caudoviricetes sp.]